MIEPKRMPAEEVARRVDETLRELHLPDDIVRWTSAPGSDWEGDPVVRVLFIVRNGFVESPRLKPFLREWDLAINDALREVLPDHWPIVTYRSESDQADIEAGDLSR